MRKKIAAGNWKMNMTPSAAAAFAADVKEFAKGADKEVIVCVPAIDIVPGAEVLKDSNVAVGAQNMYFEDDGAYTGETSANMLLDAGVKYVVIGHSERRGYFGETNVDINLKVRKAISKGLIPIMCCGESLDQRMHGIEKEWIRMQIKEGLLEVDKKDAAGMVIAYEPIWAIGTGKTATNEQAQEICAEVRKCLAEIYDQETADAIRVLYGGSVNAGNAAELFAMPDIDGGLVGGASLKPAFKDIIHA